LTYNFFLRPPGINNNGNDHKEERLLKFSDTYMALFDVICLQEVFAFGSTRRTRLIEAAKKVGLSYSSCNRNPCFIKGIDGGLVILSKFPIVKSSNLTYKHGVHSDALSNKGCLYVKLNIQEDFHIHVFNTHTQASYSNDLPLDDKSVQIRLKQIAELRRFINETLVGKPIGELVFLCGDFNVNSRLSRFENDKSSTEEYNLMSQALSQTVNAPGVSGETVSDYKFRDLLFDQLGYHPITYGDFLNDKEGKPTPREVILTAPADYCSAQSLDYIFQLDESNETSNLPCKAKVHSMQVEQFFIPEPTDKSPYTQMSDHYGLSVQIDILRD